jgi:serine/threonine-protein kinase
MDDPLEVSLELASSWCRDQGTGWSLIGRLGKGGTAPVFEISSPDGLRALKIYDAEFSTGEKGEIERKRIGQQLDLKGHDCPYLVQVYGGGEFKGRLYLLMSRAPGMELEKRLPDIPRTEIRAIVDKVARAALFLNSKDLCHRDIKAANIFISDDFSQVTLLDISVVRNIYDPIGVGTDQGGKLPVLATARYSPPEYLFRLLGTGPQLWHALTVYQLGALIHDLIVREPLFQVEYAKSATNRYRFAWIVATSRPKIEANDVDRDLIFIADLALDKDWERRSRLRLEDFLSDPIVEQNHALQILGISANRSALRSSEDLVGRLKRVRQVAKWVEEAIREYLKGQGVKAMHSSKSGSDDTVKLIVLSWKTTGASVEDAPTLIELQISLKLDSGVTGNDFRISAMLSEKRGGGVKNVTMGMPDVKDVPDCESQIVAQVVGAISRLAVDLARA